MIVIRHLSPYGITGTTVSDIQRLLGQLSGNPQTLSITKLANICMEHTVLLAVEDAGDARMVVGMATLVIIDQLVGRRGRVEDVVVDREYRGKGVGRKLMEALHDAAKKQEVSKLALSSRPDREAANALYLKLGYTHVETNVYVLDLSQG